MEMVDLQNSTNEWTDAQMFKKNHKKFVENNKIWLS